MRKSIHDISPSEQSAKADFGCLFIVLAIFAILGLMTFFIAKLPFVGYILAFVVSCAALIGLLMAIGEYISRKAYKMIEGEIWFVYTPRRSSQAYIEKQVIPKLNSKIKPVLLPHGKIPWETIGAYRGKDLRFDSGIELERKKIGFPRLVVFHGLKKTEIPLNGPFYDLKNRGEPLENIIELIESKAGSISERYQH